MTHDELIEAVARALCKLANGDRIDPDEKWNGQPWWAAFVDDARAAIRVIAPAVLEEAANAADWTPCAVPGCPSFCDDSARAIRAMKTRYEQ